MNFEQRMQADAALINQSLTDYIPAKSCLQKPLLDAMRYSLMGGGKRIRPVLTLGFCRACGGEPAAALPLACAAVSYTHLDVYKRQIKSVFGLY